MKQWMIVPIAASFAQICLAAPQKAPTALESFKQCQAVYGKTTFVVDGKDNVVDVALAAKNGPCVAGLGNSPSIFVPQIDKKSGVTTMQEATNDAQVRTDAIAFRRDLAMFKRVQPKETQASLHAAMEAAKQWSGPAQFIPATSSPNDYEIFGAVPPVRGTVVAGYGQPMPPQARLQSAPLYPHRARNIPEAVGQIVAAPVVGGGRVVGAIGHGIDQGSRNLSAGASYNLDHLPNNPAVVVAVPLNGAGVAVGGVGSIAGKIIGNVGDFFGYAPYRADEAEHQAEQRRWMERAGGSY